MHHPLEHAYARAEYSHALLPGVSPLVSFQIRTTTYLGSPFTKCNGNQGYTKRNGIFHIIMTRVVQAGRRNFERG